MAISFNPYLGYFQGEPSMHILRYRGGRVLAHGPGLTFWYLRHNTVIAAVPVMSQDAQFIFKEATASFQEVSIQGALSYRIAAPLEAAGRLDFSIDPQTRRYRSKDPEKLAQRIVNSVQSHARGRINGLSLEAALTHARDLAGEVLRDAAAEPGLRALGVYLESLHFTAVAATPEMRKALEADYREDLQRRADQAIYARRAAAAEEERKIKGRELETDIEIENGRQALVAMQARNSLTLAEAEARAEELKLSPYGALAPQALVGLALKEWAGHAGNIGNLSITPDMLGQLVGWIGRGRT